jgi:protein SCO1/2
MLRKLAVTLGCFWLLAGWSGAQSEAPAPEIGLDQRLDELIPLNLVFRDETGQAVALSQLMEGKPVILVLAYYRCPRLCSLVLNGLVESLQRVDYDIGKEFTVVTVSIDPRETPELAAAKKAAYVEHYGRNGADSGWHFLTGDDSAIKQLAASVGFRYSYDARRDQYDHAAGIMILTPEGKLARYFYGVSFSPRDLRFGLEDAAAGKIGSPVARPLRLLCFAYDPQTGTYTFMTMRLAQIGGIITVLFLAGFWLRAWRRERRQANLAPTGGK